MFTIDSIEKETNLISQPRYDLDNKLTKEEIMEIKTLSREKRVDYGISPIGTGIFRFVSQKEPNIFFEAESFDNKELDALIYLPNPNKDMAFIILNSNQPLLNQVFATAHEYYHYIKDLEEIRNNPRICSLSSSKDKSEQKASRFAAELLLPDEALRIYVERFEDLIKRELKNAKFPDIAALCYALTINYCIPLKAVMFRLYEENYSGEIINYLSNYEFLKKIFTELNYRWSKQAKELMNSDNAYIEEIIYDLMGKAYEGGFVSSEILKKDIISLNLRQDFLGFIEKDNNDEYEDISVDIRDCLLKKLNGDTNG